jgi:hypothetical protein
LHMVGWLEQLHYALKHLRAEGQGSRDL